MTMTRLVLVFVAALCMISVSGINVDQAHHQALRSKRQEKMMHHPCYHKYRLRNMYKTGWLKFLNQRYFREWRQCCRYRNAIGKTAYCREKDLKCDPRNQFYAKFKDKRICQKPAPKRDCELPHQKKTSQKLDQQSFNAWRNCCKKNNLFVRKNAKYCSLDELKCDDRFPKKKLMCKN